jgi:hypothetical protein
MPRDVNHFFAVADWQIVAPVKARQRGVEMRRARHAVHQDELGTAYRRWRHERREALLAGQHGDAARCLIDFLEDMGSTTARHLFGWSRGDSGGALISTLVLKFWR